MSGSKDGPGVEFERVSRGSAGAVGKYSVGKVAQLAGVTIRTLHHYGEIGLLVPSERSPAGYRLYSDADLDRLGRILYYRELGFALDAIATLLDDASIDPVEHMRRQHELLTQRLGRVQAMVAAIEKELEAMMSGINLTSEEKLAIFGQQYNKEWETEAKERWGDTEAWRQSQSRTAHFTKDDWVRYQADTDALHSRLADGFQAGYATDSPEAMDLAEEHRQWVSLMWDCSPEMHRGLADMYLADERFTKTYEDLAPGLTQWLHDAIHANASRLTS
jgi:DNA-binding transcriptional MerR regulator